MPSSLRGVNGAPPVGSIRANRGPAAAAENRSAILAAARRLFAAEGYLVPLSAIARAAGVSQGVLYRHFRSRLALAHAVFEDNLAVLAAIADSAEPDCFTRLWRTLLAQTVREAAFVEMVLEARSTDHTYDGDTRLATYVAQALATSQAQGGADPGLTPQAVYLAWRMAFGLVITAESEESALADLASAQLLGIALGSDSPETGV